VHLFNRSLVIDLVVMKSLLQSSLSSSPRKTLLDDTANRNVEKCLPVK